MTGLESWGDTLATLINETLGDELSRRLRVSNPLLPALSPFKGDKRVGAVVNGKLDESGTGTAVDVGSPPGTGDGKPPKAAGWLAAIMAMMPIPG